MTSWKTEASYNGGCDTNPIWWYRASDKEIIMASFPWKLKDGVSQQGIST
jgi:hypothetical protein